MILTTACGRVRLGASTPNDPTPDGTLVSQGVFNTPENGKSVTGSAVIYSPSTGTYTLQLVGLSAPSEAQLQVRVVPAFGTTFTAGLRATNGTQDYDMGATGVLNWKYVEIYSTLTGLEYGRAVLN